MDKYYLKKLNDFCRTGHTYYLDRMDPRILQELHEIVIDNKHKLTNNKIAKIVLKYYEKRHRKEEEMIQKATDMDYLRDNILPNVLPIVLQSFLESMLGIKKYTNKQMVIYKYARSAYPQEGDDMEKVEDEGDDEEIWEDEGDDIEKVEDEGDDEEIWEDEGDGYEDDEEIWEEYSGEDVQSQIDTPLEKACTQVRGLDYTGNSCYMDSVLLCLFAIPNKTITDNILNKNLDKLKDIKKLDVHCDSKNIENDIKRRKAVQTALNSITNSMRKLDNKVKTCSNLRGLLGKCVLPQEFNKTVPQDAGEFLTYLFNMFQVQIMTERKKFYGRNDKGQNIEWVYVRKQKSTHYPIILIESSSIAENPPGYDISQFVEKHEEISYFDENNFWRAAPGINFKVKKEVKTNESPLIILRLQRQDRRKIIKNKVYIPETIQPGKKTLHLYAMVVHNGSGHYTANFKCKGNWFFYDDVKKDKIQYLGSYEKMLKNKHNSPQTLGTLFFYGE